MGDRFSSFFSLIFDLMVPPRATERVVRSLHLETLSSLNASGALPYHDPRVKALVWEIKYHASARAAALAGAMLAEELLGIAQEMIGTPLLVPVPMHTARRRERGHNQTELLCKAALNFFSSSSAPLEYAPNILIKTKITAPQQGLQRHLRLQNIHGSMEVKKLERVRGRACIVVDDVSTTGATFAEARRALTAAGAREVVCLALARS